MLLIDRHSIETFQKVCFPALRVLNIRAANFKFFLLNSDNKYVFKCIFHS